MPIEIQKLIGEVAARNHCRIEASDPIFAVSTINRLMLDEVVEGLILRVGAAISAFEASARAVDAHAGKLLAEEIRTSTSAWKAEIARDINIANVRSCEMIDKLNMAHSKPAMILWGGLGLFAGLASFGRRYIVGLVCPIDQPQGGSVSDDSSHVPVYLASGPQGLLPLHSILCAWDAVAVLLPDRRVAACAVGSGARHKEPLSGHAEAKSGSPEHSGSDAQKNEQRPSNATQRPRA
jgi:hypothetical protein